MASDVDLSKSEDGATFTLCHFRTLLPGGQTKSANEPIGLAIGPLVIAQAQDGLWRISHLSTGAAVASFDWWDEAATAASRMSRLEWPADLKPGSHAPPLLREQIKDICRSVREQSTFLMVDPTDRVVG